MSRPYAQPRRRQPSMPAGLLGPRVVFTLGFFVVLGIFSAIGRLPWGIFAVYLIFSLITFGTYAYDKFSAKTGRWRTPEKTLLTLGLFGGWPGAMLAQNWIRHKSSKSSFQIAFWATVLINCAFLAWVVTQAPETFEALLRRIMSVAD